MKSKVVRGLGVALFLFLVLSPRYAEAQETSNEYCGPFATGDLVIEYVFGPGLSISDQDALRFFYLNFIEDSKKPSLTILEMYDKSIMEKIGDESPEKVLEFKLSNLLVWAGYHFRQNTPQNRIWFFAVINRKYVHQSPAEEYKEELERPSLSTQPEKQKYL